MDFLRGGPIFGEKNGNRNRNEPEPVEPNRGFKDLGVNRTEPNRTVGFLLDPHPTPIPFPHSPPRIGQKLVNQHRPQHKSEES